MPGVFTLVWCDHICSSPCPCHCTQILVIVLVLESEVLVLVLGEKSFLTSLAKRVDVCGHFYIFV